MRRAIPEKPGVVVVSVLRVDSPCAFDNTTFMSKGEVAVSDTKEDLLERTASLAAAYGVASQLNDGTRNWVPGV
jgi:hypothetical protein